MVFRMNMEVTDTSNAKSSRVASEGNKQTLLSRVSAFTRPRNGGRKRADSVPLNKNPRKLTVLAQSLINPHTLSAGGSMGKNNKITIFGTDLYHDDFITGRIASVSEDFLVTHMELEEMIVRKDAMFFEALGNLFRDDHRVWQKVKFRDSMTITTYDEYKSMKLSLISSLASAKEKEVPVTFQAKVRFFKKMGSMIILNSLQELLSDTSIKDLVLSGDLIGSDSSDAEAWEKLADMLHSEHWDRLNINLFYDLNASHPDTEKPWIAHLQKTIETLEEKFSGGKKLRGRNILPGNTEWADFLEAMASSDFDSVRTGRTRSRSFNESSLIAFSTRDLVKPENQQVQRHELPLGAGESNMNLLADIKEDTVDLGYEDVMPTSMTGRRKLRRSLSFDESTMKILNGDEFEEADLKSADQEVTKDDNASSSLANGDLKSLDSRKSTPNRTRSDPNRSKSGKKSATSSIKSKKKKKASDGLESRSCHSPRPAKSRMPIRSISHEESTRKVSTGKKHSTKSSKVKREVPVKSLSSDQSTTKVSDDRREALIKSLSQSGVRVPKKKSSETVKQSTTSRKKKVRGVEIRGSGSGTRRGGRSTVRVKLSTVKSNSNSPNGRVKSVSPSDLKAASCHEARHMDHSRTRSPRRFAKIRDPEGEHIAEKLSLSPPRNKQGFSRTKTH